MTALEPNSAVGTIADDTPPADQYSHTGAAPTADPGAALPAGMPADAQIEAAVADVEDYVAGQAAGPVPVQPPQRPPILLRQRRVSGRYRSPAAGFQLELRVDADGRRPLMQISGDYFLVSGGTTTYFGSWRVDAITTSTVGGSLVCVGTARTTWATTFTVATVTIPRRLFFQPAAPATVQWSTPSGARGATYVCGFESGSMRTVELEQDVEAGITAFASYDTGSLPSGGPARRLSVLDAYAEAGVQVLDTGGTNTIATSPTHIWNNASLHNAMVRHFSRHAERPQFSVWLLHAREHELTRSRGLLGIMFDQQGLQRQGCASFYATIQPSTLQNLRTQLYLNVHELGHCFNLYHSFHKEYMTPPLPNRPGALSWMNYPQNYDPGTGGPRGAAAFWGAFPFQFDDLELAHLRHAFRPNVIMGGSPFGTGAALEVPIEPDDALADTSGLRLAVRTSPARPMLGTPVVLEIELTAERGQMVHPADMLHPKYGVVQVVISRPRGDVVVHRPPVQHCAHPELVRASAGEVLPTSAYIGYDAAVGQIFEDPGTYRIRAVYHAPDGSVIVSGSTLVRVWSPAAGEDGVVADLMLREETGMVLTLLGSDSSELSEGTDALEEVVSEHGDHPTAVYARLALGMNAARPFTDVAPDGSVSVRERDLDEADRLLRSAIEDSRHGQGLDDLTVLQVMAYLADSHAAEGDPSAAADLRQEAAHFAEQADLPEAALDMLPGDDER